MRALATRVNRTEEERQRCAMLLMLRDTLPIVVNRTRKRFTLYLLYSVVAGIPKLYII